MAKTILPRPAEETSPRPERGNGRPGFQLSARGTFAALRYRNYRLWFAGQLISLVGTWMQTTAQGYLVFELTRSAAFLGYVGFAAGVPTWLFMLYGGVVADRMPRRNLLVMTQVGMMLLAFILAGLTFAERIQPWHIVAFAFLLGIANAFDAPTRQSFVVEMVDREDLTNAIALNSTMFNSATAIGPAVAGITYALVGPAWCFTINGISFLAVILGLLRMRLKAVPLPSQREPALSGIQTGLRYVASHAVIRVIIANLAVVSLFGLGFVILMPAWAVEILGGDASTNGFLQSARGFGALIGALMIAAFGHYGQRGRLLTVGSFVFPLLVLVFAAVRWLPLSMLILVGVGWGFMVAMNSSNVIVQTQVRDELRGRVMSIYTLTFFGLIPVGSLLAGAVAARLGEPVTVVLGALVLLGFAGLIYVKVPGLREA